MPFRGTMLRRIRLARRAQLVLWLAAMISVGGSLGLHPEPGEAGVRSPGCSGPRSTQTIHGDIPARHSCLACLSHRPISIASMIAAPSARVAAVPFPHSPSQKRGQRLELSSHEGRAPPATL